MIAAALRRIRVPEPSASERDVLPFGIVLLVVLLCALLTIAISGQQAGQNNNLFHMPILERLYDRPQFADDQYML